MTRVSENSTSIAVGHALGKARQKMENLQLKGSNLKEISRPSDNPIGSIEILGMNSKLADNEQYLKNASHALFHLGTTERSLDQLSEVVTRAKELAIGLASDIYNRDIRENIATEVDTLRDQAIGIANKRVGNRFIFGGFKNHIRPFEENGAYRGDEGHIKLEVSKDFFVQINLHGKEVFFGDDDLGMPSKSDEKLNKSPSRSLASIDLASQVGLSSPKNLFDQLSTLSQALISNDSKGIQKLLPLFDQSLSQIVKLRTQIGSLENSIIKSTNAVEDENIQFQDYKSKLADAEVGKIFSDISRQKSVLQATHQASGKILNKTLLDFIG